MHICSLIAPLRRQSGIFFYMLLVALIVLLEIGIRSWTGQWRIWKASPWRERNTAIHDDVAPQVDNRAHRISFSLLSGWRCPCKFQWKKLEFCVHTSGLFGAAACLRCCSLLKSFFYSSPVSFSLVMFFSPAAVDGFLLGFPQFCALATKFTEKEKTTRDLQ